jgi:hypothetical protein
LYEEFENEKKNEKKNLTPRAEQKMEKFVTANFFVVILHFLALKCTKATWLVLETKMVGIVFPLSDMG